MAAAATVIISLLYYHPAILYADGGQYYMMAGRFVSTGSLHPEDVDPPITPYGELLTVNGGLEWVWMYPPGMAVLLLAPAMLVFGAGAAFAVVPVLSFLSLTAFYALCTRLVSGRMALLALLLAILAPCRNALFPSILSHAASAFLLILGLLFAERWFRLGKGGTAFACGVALGLIPSFRYPETVYLIAIGLIASVQAVRGLLPWRSFLFFCAGAVVPIALLAAYNIALMGGPFRTGYSSVGANRDFGLDIFRTNAFPYIELLFYQFGPHLLILASAGFVAMARSGSWKWLARAMLLLSAFTVFLYMAYLWIADLRYMMPLIYPVILAAVFFLEQLRSAARSLFRPVVASTVLLSMIPAAQHFNGIMPIWEREARVIDTLVGVATDHCPENSVIIVNTAVGWTLNLAGGYDLVLTETMPQNGDFHELLSVLLDRYGSFYILDTRKAEEQMGCQVPVSVAVDTICRVDVVDDHPFPATLPALIITAMGDVSFELLHVRPALPGTAASGSDGRIRGASCGQVIRTGQGRMEFLPELRESKHPDPA
jgi:hypothetical protein